MATIQLLLADDSNCRALASIVEEHYTAVRGESIQDADLYIVDERTFPQHRDDLERRKREAGSVFCPVVLLRRDRSPVSVSLPDPEQSEPPLLINEVLKVPVEKQALFRSLTNLLARRTRTEQLTDGLEQLAEQLRHRTEQLEEQRDDLELLNQILRHDIRNDLQVITTYAELLATRLDGDHGEYLDRILDSADHAVGLTKSAGTMADLMLSTEADREPVSLTRTLQEELSAVRTEHPEARIEVAGTLPEVTVTASDMLDAVFRNLLKNAIQHNDKPTPHVTVSLDECGGTVSLRIADNGPGVPDDQKEEIFGKGETGLASDGTGIGLYLVQTLVESHGGAVRVEDNDPVGAVFVVELPTERGDDGER